MTSIAESLLAADVHLNAPTEAAVAEICALPPQPSLLASTTEPEKSCSWGSGRVPVTPKGTSAGPEARMRTEMCIRDRA